MSTQCHIEETEKSYQGHIFVLSPTLVSFIEFLNYFDYLRGHFIKRTDGILPMYVKVSLLMFLGKNKSYNTFFKIYLFQVFAFQHSFLLFLPFQLLKAFSTFFLIIISNGFAFWFERSLPIFFIKLGHVTIG